MATTQKRMRAKSIGHYILGKTIGEGTFGKVKVGNHILTGEKVAVKILEKERIVDVADVGRVAREIHILKLIQHPHVIRLFEIIETPRQLYLIMEYCSGGELFDLIVASGRVQERDACAFFQQILAGVEQIHRKNVVHRDLKPENLLLDENRNIKIVDFGLSNTFQDGQLLKTACGSPCYAPPEMIAGQRYVPACCDLWSCGVILFALVCGYLPFEDQNTSELYKKILGGDYQTPNFISNAVRDLIQRLLTTDPVQRITSEQVRLHPWFTQIPESAMTSQFSHGGEELQEDLIEHLERFGFLREYAIKCLQMNKHNHVTTTYHLLAEKKRRLEGRLMEMCEPYASTPREEQACAFAAFDKLAEGEDAINSAMMPDLADREQADADRAGGTSPAPRAATAEHTKQPPGTGRQSNGVPAAHHGQHEGQVSGDTPRRVSARQTSTEAPVRAAHAPYAYPQSQSPTTSTPLPMSARGPSWSRVPSHVTPQKKPTPTPQQATPPLAGSLSHPRPGSSASAGSQSARVPTVTSRVGGVPVVRGPSRPSGCATARTANDVRRRQFSAAGGDGQYSNPSSARGIRSPLGYVSAASPEPSRSGSGRPTTGSIPAPAWSPRNHSGSVQASLGSPRTSTTQDNEGGTTAQPPSARDTKDEMRSCRGAFNVSCTSSRSPRVILQEIQRALALNRVASKQASAYIVRCQKQSLRFEMEIANLDQLESIHVVRFRRLAGDTALFKDLCGKILADMKI
mmetsp:Transcript_65315/g.121756  ORF Transcript_65315/g.121756 Transcript_65315/m.121756 type:complete len:743 (-) Transcript_65315:107-2335(-)